ncbi:MAG: hypothetical protein ACR2ML_13395 [Solirubrobacteraceae bacterium]
MAQRVLVLTNEDLADANEVPEAIRPFIDEAEEIYVVAPTLTTWMQWLADDRDRALVSADERLRAVFDHMRAGGLKPHGEIGAENQVTAIADALARFDADLIVLRLHAPGTDHENWREHRIAEKVRSHFDVATIVFYFDSEGHVVERDEANERVFVDMNATPTPADPHHTQTVELGWEEIVEALAALESSCVAVRIVERGDRERLVAVFRGHLRAPTGGKHPTIFWPVHAAGEDAPGNVEDTGVYLQRDRFHGSLASPGRDVLHILQGPVIVNVRRVSASPSLRG